MFVFSLTGCSALRGSRRIRILGSTPDERKRGHRDGLGKSPRSPRHLFRHVLRARLLRDLFRSLGSTSQPLDGRPYKRSQARPLLRTLPFSLLFLPIPLPLSLPPRRWTSARAQSATMGKDKTAALERAKKATTKEKGKRTSRADPRRGPAYRRAGSRVTGSAQQSRRTTSTAWWRGD